MKKRKLLALCLTAGLAALTAGCGSKDAASSTTTTAAASAETTAVKTEPEAATLSEEDTLKLYNTYIEINNMMVGRFSEVIDSYFTYVEPQEEFVTLNENYWCLSCNATFYKDMDLAHELANKKEEKDAVDEAYLALYPVMEKLAATIDEVAEYTDLKDFLNDDYAKGKELHATIWETYTQYETLATTFVDQLSIVADEKRDEDMESLKEEGYVVTYSIMKMISTAQEIQEEIYAQDIDDSRIIELDIEALQPLYDQYMEEAQICLDYLADEKAMGEEGYPTMSAYFYTFKTAVAEAKTAMTEIFQRVKDQEPIDEFQLDSLIPADGSIAKFDDQISKMIDDYNTMLSY